ncbi:MAG: hypothetical protein HKN79_07720 [Flavobacteriales bacterium]|nr:hypothetical protein [Flavobacteriales bacterium]
MKNVILILLCTPLMFHAQTELPYADIAPGWKKDKDRAYIIQKMDELIDEVSFEYACAKEEVSYLVTEKYDFYRLNKDDRNFPKEVSIKACGETYYYLIECLPNDDGDPKDWFKCKWILMEDTPEK